VGGPLCSPLSLHNLSLTHTLRHTLFYFLSSPPSLLHPGRYTLSAFADRYAILLQNEEAEAAIHGTGELARAVSERESGVIGADGQAGEGRECSSEASGLGEAEAVIHTGRGSWRGR
jgi:hypothetical protein